MKYELTGGTAYPIAVIHLNNGEKVKIERGAMAYKRNVDIKGKMNSNGKSGLGGLVRAIGRSLTSGESMFITEAEGFSSNAELGIAPANVGKIKKLEVGPHHYILNTGAYLASDHEVSYRMVTQKLSRALFGRTGGFFVMETQGYGDLLISSFGDIVELEVTADTPLTIDNEHVLAWSSGLDYNIEIASGLFGFTTGEGLVNTFRGNGTVFIQTRNVRNLAEALLPFIPTSSN